MRIKRHVTFCMFLLIGMTSSCKPMCCFGCFFPTKHPKHRQPHFIRTDAFASEKPFRNEAGAFGFHHDESEVPLTGLAGAVVSGDSAEVNHFIELGCNLNKPSQNGFTPLHWAAYPFKKNYRNEAQKVVIMITLIRNGANVDARDWAKNTPLHKAMQAGMLNDELAIKGMLALVQQGADVNAQNNENNTPAHFLVSQDPKPTVIKALFECGADADIQNERGDTVLHVFIKTLRTLNQVMTENKENRYVCYLRNKCKCCRREKTEDHNSYGSGSSSYTRDYNYFPGDNTEDYIIKLWANIQSIFELFHDNGADATLSNADGKSCIDLLQDWLAETNQKLETTYSMPLEIIARQIQIAIATLENTTDADLMERGNFAVQMVGERDHTSVDLANGLSIQSMRSMVRN